MFYRIGNLTFNLNGIRAIYKNTEITEVTGALSERVEVIENAYQLYIEYEDGKIHVKTWGDYTGYKNLDAGLMPILEGGEAERDRIYDALANYIIQNC